MYVRGMRGYRRGLGQLNCPGDPGCPGNIQPDSNSMIGAPLSPAQIAALSIGNAAYFNQPTAAAGGQTLTTWLNSNALTAIIGTTIFLVAWKAFVK